MQQNAVTATLAGPAASQAMPWQGVAALSLPVVESARLMAGGREIVIQHAGQSYRLRVTRANKLILTK
ncbi:hemin uptake protein HemP [Azospirillum agricola]|uniref:hemin uptake protein HemP n=1 Tax=Azospirillum agricola TaxID=1720247 RepID=UPI001CBD710C|nr:hemin uptake protein HemP [Azospirillum agricola]MBP2231984.1 hemin uptake protein HemP [Azospirillum agricola]